MSLFCVVAKFQRDVVDTFGLSSSKAGVDEGADHR